jgi:hypothetical protein
MKIITTNLEITPRKNGEYYVKTAKCDFFLLRTGDGEHEYLEVFPHDFPFRKLTLKSFNVPMEILETMIAKELSEYTANLIDI